MHGTIDTDLEIRVATDHPTAAVRVTRAPAALSQAFGEFLPRIAAAVASRGGAIAGPPYARYHGMSETTFDVEIGAPVEAVVPGLPALADASAGDVGASALPGGRLAVDVHIGPYATLGAAWHAIDGKLAAAGLEPVAPGWEMYVDDPDQVAPDRLRTEIVIPVR